jgi:fumarate reductase subunit C
VPLQFCPNVPKYSTVAVKEGRVVLNIIVVASTAILIVVTAIAATIELRSINKRQRGRKQQ